MRYTFRYLTVFLALLPVLCWAQPSAGEDSAAAAARPATATAPLTHTTQTSPAVDWLADGVTVTEDSNVRIEQTRRRGQVERLRVLSKVGGGSRYEIVMRPGRDPSALNLAGKSAWQVLSF